MKKEIATMEIALKKQAADMDSVELMDARLDIRKEQERFAIDRVKTAYGEKNDPVIMAGGRNVNFHLSTLTEIEIWI